MSRILITGASGNVGKYVAAYALKMDRDYCGRHPYRDVDRMFGNTAKIVYLDFTDPATFKPALENADRVFIIRPPHLGKPENLKPFVEALKEHGSIRLVSFISPWRRKKSGSAPTIESRNTLNRQGLPYCHIRPSFFMQNISGVHAFEIKHFNRVVVPVKNALTSFIDTEDIGEITAKVLSEPELHQNRAYSITGPDAIDYWRVAKNSV